MSGSRSRKRRARLLKPVLAALLLLCSLVLWPSAPAGAKSFERASQNVDEQLARSLRDLASTRDRIAGEKIPLSKSLSALENEVIQLRREKARLLKLRDSRSIDLSFLRKQVDSLGEQEVFVDSRLNEFTRDFEGRLDVSELAEFEELTAAAKLAEGNPALDADQRRATQLAVVEAALGRLSAQLGGRIFTGEALAPDGVLTQGRFIALGPAVFFSSQDGSVAGIVQNQLNAADPVVVELPGGLASGIREFAEQGSGELPFDGTLGKALRVEVARKSLMQYAEDGGLVGYVILGLGAAALLLTLFKSVEILGFKVAEPREVDGVLNELATGSQEGAAKKAKRVQGIAGEMLSVGVQHADDKRSVLEELLFQRILGARPALERFLPFLSITAAAAPLLGLLGTVIGMIKTFQLITIFGTGDAKSLSSGISEALVTTALGLMVAIPVLIMHGALSRMAKRKLGLLEELSVAFVNGVEVTRRDDDRLLER